MASHRKRMTTLPPSAKPVLLSLLLALSFKAGTFTGSRCPGSDCTLHLETSQRQLLPAHQFNFSAFHNAEDYDIPRGLKLVYKGYTDRLSFSRLLIDPLTLHKYVPAADKLPRLAVSLTTMPGRFGRFVPIVLQSLLDQDFQPDVIYVNIPRMFRRSVDNFTVPEWLVNGHPRVKLLRPAVDYGPATKLIPAIEAELAAGYTDTRIVTVDDDLQMTIKKDTLLGLYATSLRFPDAVLGAEGWNVTCVLQGARCKAEDTGLPRRVDIVQPFNFVRRADSWACWTMADLEPGYYFTCMGGVRLNHAAWVDVLEGFAGVLYQPRFFNITELKSLVSKDIPNVPDTFFYTDDVWFSGWLGTRDTPKLVVNPHLDGKPVYNTLKKVSDAKNITRSIQGLNPPKVPDDRFTAEEGLHSDSRFIEHNRLGVQWFEEKGAWGSGWWDRPDGFRYLSEIGNGTTTSLQSSQQ